MDSQFSYDRSRGGCLGWDGFGILLYSAKDSVKNRNYLTIFCFGALHHTFLLAIHGALQLRSVFLLSCFALFFIRVKCPIQGPAVLGWDTLAFLNIREYEI